MSISDESESPVPNSHPASHLRSAAEHLGQAREHLSAGVGQARDDLTTGVADAMSSSKEAAREAKAELDDKLDQLIDQGKDLFGQAEDLIRSRPWTSFGAAFAAGYLIARLTRRS